MIQNERRRVESNCHFYSPFKYGSAIKSTPTSPCTNVPIYCPHCKETTWKYNAVDHILTTHPGLDASNLDKHFMIDIQIQTKEEELMKILPELTNDYRNKHSSLLLSGEGLATAERQVEQEHKPKKRSRSPVGNSKNKRQRR